MTGKYEGARITGFPLHHFVAPVKTSGPLCKAAHLKNLLRSFSLRRPRASGPLPQPQSWVARAAEAPLLPDQAIVVSEEPCVRPEIRAHHDGAVLRVC